MRRVSVDFKEIGRRHGVTAAEAEEVWMSMFRFISEKASSYDFTQIEGEELDNLNADFVIPGLGRLRLNRKRTRNRIAKYKANQEYRLSLQQQETQQHERNQGEEDQAGVHDGAADL